ncbi:MAG: pilus assembly protein PilP [Thermodesulfobacteriota bacterium]|nr:pilus assembly protein PilP [Thermodesulfobacteriota bacterium]
MKNRIKRRNNHPLKWVAAVLTVLLLFPVTTVVYCADPEEPDTGTYRYNPEGKPDPFKPFIEIVEENKKAQKTEKHKGAVSLPLPPLQRFGIEEFRLTGIVLTGAKMFAMVETPEGKRYVLRRNTRIGINGGRVIKILSDSVVVLEKIKDFEGNINTERIVLTLRKNGGNP